MIIEIQEKQASNISSLKKKPEIGFLGMGWIGKSRLKAVRDSSIADITAICDPHADDIEEFCRENNFKIAGQYSDLLHDDNIDGIIIATPNAQHKEQAIEALRHGKAVFCQKPLARTWQETQQLVQTARTANRLLMADMSYRHTRALAEIRNMITSGKLGKVFAAHLIFHNAYGPDKPWYYNPELSGGGCVMDLGVHLVDALYWIFPDLEVENTNSRLFFKGKPLSDFQKGVEDYGMVQIDFANNFSAQLSCSWNLPAGKDAVIELSFYGTKGGASFFNLDGSFYDFKAELYTGTKSQTLSLPPDDWSGRAAVKWAAALAESSRYIKDTDSYLKTAQTLDLIYGR